MIHAAPAISPGTGWLLPLLVMAALALPYVLAVYVQNMKKQSWSLWRNVSFVLGLALLGLALTPGVMAFAHQDLRGHMVQHLLLGMLAPLGLVLAAPITVVLRALPVQASRRLVAFLQSRFVQFVSHPVTALIFNIGGMYLLYLTPLYTLSLHNPVVHVLVHVHFVIAGCLFTWAIAGPDPGPHRPAWQFRLILLFVSMAMHAFLSKAMYAYGWPRGAGHSLQEIQAAAKLMYYGGDFAELCLLAALLSSVFLSTRRTSPVSV